MPSRSPRPANEPQWVIRQILARRITISAEEPSTQYIEYLIQWDGYPIAEASWEPGPVIAHDAPAAITDFEQRLRAARWRSQRRASGSIGAPPSNGTGRPLHVSERESESEIESESERERE